VLSYYVTDRTQFAGSESERRAQLLRTVRGAVAAGVDYIELRESDLCIRELELFAREVLQAIRSAGPARLLIDHRTDVALGIGADGVHLRASDIAASDARALAATSGAGQFVVAVDCRFAEEVRLAEAHGADVAVLAPVFEKISVAGNAIGLEELRRATLKDRSPDMRVEAGDTRRMFPVFAAGCADFESARHCANAGAMGIAGTRLFQQSLNLPTLVRSIRSI